LRVAYTFEQSWHRVPGGTAVAALKVAELLARCDDVCLVGVAGRHLRPPRPEFAPPVPVRALPLGGPWLYHSWLRWGWPTVESVTGPVDVVHATGLIPARCDAPLVVTVHDLAWRHHPEHFTRNGVAVFERSLALIRDRAALVLCASVATMDDCEAAGIERDRLRHVPLGVDVSHPTIEDLRRVRREHELPAEYLLFVGTVEPRKNLARLVDAVRRLARPLPLVVAGAPGWGDAGIDADGVDVRFLGFVPERDLAPIYAGAEVFCYPSLMEGYGLPVLEAMAHGVPVVTSLGTSTEEVAQGSAVLVDPLDVDDIARGIESALARREELARTGRQIALRSSWRRTAELTLAAYRELAR
jgi:glycosyltransferase involved in cell wall biosynthesis